MTPPSNPSLHSAPPPAPFRAELTPNRSLGPRGFFVFMALVSPISFGAGMVFYLNGAWPVFAFFGLDVALIYLAFRLNYRAGRLRELVELSTHELLVTRIEPSGRVLRWSFNPYWTRVAIDEPDEDTVRLSVRSHGVEVSLGAFLSPDERRQFGQVLAAALSDTRAGLQTG